MTFNVSNRVDFDNPLPVDDQGAPNIASGCVTVSAARTLIVPARVGRKAVLLSRDAICAILIGNETVTFGNGYRPFMPSQTYARIETSAAIYGLVPGTGELTVDISYLELF
jgi:hypothetical protein